MRIALYGGSVAVMAWIPPEKGNSVSGCLSSRKRTRRQGEDVSGLPRRPGDRTRLSSCRLGVDPARVAVHIGDSALTPLTGGTFATRQLYMSGNAALTAARFGILLETGRPFCGGGINLQGLPHESQETDPAATVRGCFVPGRGQVCALAGM